MGELLKTFNAQGRRADALSDGTVRKLTQKREAAHAAGISERQEATAVRVANVPADKFEAAIEFEKPETVTALAEMGKRVGAVPVESALARSADWQSAMVAVVAQRYHGPKEAVRPRLSR